MTPRPDAVPALVGAYAVNGIDPLGAENSGVLTITDADTPGQYGCSGS